MIFRRNWLLPLGVIGGILQQYELLPAWMLVLLLTAVTGLLICRRQGRFAPLGWLGALLGGLSVLLSHSLPPTDIARQLHHHPRRAEVRLKITDAAALGLPDDPEFTAPETLTAEILAVRFDHAAVWQPSSGQINVRFTAEAANAGLSAGETIAGSGRFQAPRPESEFRVWDRGHARDASEFAGRSWQHYLQARGIAANFIFDSYRRLPAAKPDILTRMRTILLQKIDAGIADPEQRALLGVLTLGVRSRMSPEARERFRESGTAHLFSVSGLHVGILAMLLLLLLRPASLYWRTGLLLTLVLYVLITGGDAPAIRAFLLVLLVWILRASLCQVRPLEILAGIGAGLLLWNPAFLFDAGFQYSFVITGFLILAVEPAQEIARAASGDIEWQGNPPPWRRTLLRWRGRLAAGASIALAATLGGAALSLYHQQYFFPAAFLINLLLLPVLAPLFLLALLKCLLPWGNMLWNAPCRLLLDYIDGLQAAAQLWTGGNRFLIPGWWSVLLYSALLTLALRLKNIHWRLAAWAGVALWLCWHWLGTAAAPALAVAATGGGSDRPTLAILYPRTGYMVMLNATRDGVGVIREIARYYGVNRIAWLGFYPNRIDAVSGLPQLVRDFPVEFWYLPDSAIRSAEFKAALASYPVQIAAGRPEATANAEGGEEFLLLRSAGAPPVAIRAERLLSGEWQVTVNAESLTVPPGSAPRADIIPVKL